MTEPNWAGGWRPAGYRPPPPLPSPRIQPARTARRGPAVGLRPTRRPPPGPGSRTALRALRATLDGLARVLLLFARLSVQLVSVALRLLLPAIGAQGALKRVGKF